MERKDFKNAVATWVDTARSELTDKLVEFIKGQGGKVTLWQPCLIITMDTEDECEYTSYSEIIVCDDENVVFVNENGDGDSIELFSLDEILRIIDNI
jgi:hypothetical protein